MSENLILGITTVGDLLIKSKITKVEIGRGKTEPIQNINLCIPDYQRPGITNVDSPYYNEELANRTHIPIKNPRS